MAAAELSQSTLATDANLKAYYKLENVNDSGPNGYTLTNNNTATFTDGVFGNGADFGSANSTKVLYINNNLGITGGAISMSGWINITTAPGTNATYEIFRQQDNTNWITYYLDYSDSSGTKRIQFGRDRYGVVSDSITYNTTLTTGTWYYISATYDGTNIRLYINGSLVGGPTAASGNGTSSGRSNAFGIGAAHYDTNSNTNYFSGLIDDVSIFSRALTPDEISYLATGSPIVFDSSSQGVVSPGSSPLTISHTCTGNNLVLLVGVTCETDSITGVTYDSVAMTQLVKYVDGSTGNINAMYGLLAPHTGTHNIVVSWSGSHYVGAAGASYGGVKQTGLPDAYNTAYSNSSVASLTASVTSTVDNCWATAYIYGNTTSISQGTGGTLRQNVGNQRGLEDSNAPISPAGSYSIALNFSPNSTVVADATITSFAPASYAAAAGPANLKTWNGLAKASIKTINSVAIGSIKTLNGIN